MQGISAALRPTGRLTRQERMASSEEDLRLREIERNRINHRRSHEKIKKERPWNLHYRALKERCENKNCISYRRYGGRGIKCLVTENDIRDIWIRDGASNMKSPTVDREDNDGHYVVGNIRFMEKVDNIRRAINRAVVRIKDGERKVYFSLTEAAKENNAKASRICEVCKGLGRSKRHRGFYWQYHDKESSE